MNHVCYENFRRQITPQKDKLANMRERVFPHETVRKIKEKRLSFESNAKIQNVK